MKYFILLSLLMLAGCAEPPNKEGLPSSIGVFKDNDVTCYTYYDHAISCVIDKKE